ncbi:MAG: hypothetical protein IPM54_17575 [Polyangiaceae bacterium]|nr:hypothetical protein [Polyangiaceae bacterium]
MAQHEANAIRRICKDLGLPQGDSYTQDWAYELSEEFRSEAHLYRYLAAYGNPAYGNTERRVLIQLALDVVNDLVQQDEERGSRAWAKLVETVRAHLGLHRDQIEYWAVKVNHSKMRSL